LRVSNFREVIDVSFKAIESITQMTQQINLRYVVVQLRDDTMFGRRFTFVPRSPKPPWPFSSGEDAVVIELRERVEAAQDARSGKPPHEPAGRSGRSIMADDELDGRF